jgi:hypothetical protein
MLCSVDAAQHEYKYSVRGRVVDDQGHPVKGAVVYLDPFTWADQVFGLTTGPDGKFQFEEVTAVPRDIRKLYVAGPIPPRVQRLIAPPFNLLPNLNDSAFAGKTITMERNREVDIGDVPVQITYALIKVYILDRDGAALLKTKKQWENVNLRVRNIEEVVIDDASLSQTSIEEEVDISESSIVIALPEGVWYLEIAPFGFDGPWFISRDQLKVSRGSNQLQFFFKLRTSTKSGGSHR